MNDIAAIAGHLAKLRESLQLEIDGILSFSDTEHARGIQFINELMLSCRGVDRELDSRFTKLKLKLSNSPTFTSLNAELLAIETLLLQRSNAMEESIALTLMAIELGSRHLDTLRSVSEDTRPPPKELLTSPAGYGMSDYQNKVVKLLEFYQQEIRLQLLPNQLQPTSIEPISQPDAPASNETRSNTNRLNRKTHAHIVDELQCLITELDFSGAIGERLSDIRHQLLNGINPNMLAVTCLQVIELIIEGTREERTTSRSFLCALNENLSAVHVGFTESLDEGRALQNETKATREALVNELLAIEPSQINHRTLDTLKQTIANRMDATQRQDRESMAARERQLQARLSAMESKLRLMKEETAEYKKRLTIQKHKLFLDSLTQVHNRAALDERLEQEYKRWLRYRIPLCMAIIDIDLFKSINDNYGHLAGDKALKMVAQALQSALRDTDFIARFGGEEFVVLLPSINPDKLQKPLETLRQTIKNIPFRFRDTNVEITISIGATLFKEGDNPSDVLERADKALYYAKSNGRDQVALS